METIDLGVCTGQLFRADPGRVVYLLPGATYPISAPLLWFARSVASDHGWTILQVDDTRDESDAHTWVADRFHAALDALPEPSQRAVITKSITSLCAPEAAEMALPGIWLTPLNTRGEVSDGLAANPAPTLAIGGGADPSWDRAAANRAQIEVFEVPGADHTLGGSNAAQSLEMLTSVVERMDRFFEIHLN